MSMDKIEKYIDLFFAQIEMNGRYDMSIDAWIVLAERAREKAFNATGMSFLYGYAKGYRAAVSETKKGSKPQKIEKNKIVRFVRFKRAIMITSREREKQNIVQGGGT